MEVGELIHTKHMVGKLSYEQPVTNIEFISKGSMWHKDYEHPAENIFMNTERDL